MDKWKTIILSRYLGEYQIGSEANYTHLKSSEDIVFDLSGMGEFHTNEVSAELTLRGYSVKIDQDAKPKWLLKQAVTSTKRMIEAQ